jgi:cell division septation protein DedD
VKKIVPVIFFPFFVFSQKIVSVFPEKIPAGSTFSLEVVIDRPYQTLGFSKLYMDVFPGLTVTELDSKGGIFGFEPTIKRAKIVWTNPPDSQKFSVFFQITTDPSSHDSGKISFHFSYIDGEEKKVISSSTGMIHITPEPYPVSSSSVMIAKKTEGTSGNSMELNNHAPSGSTDKKMKESSTETFKAPPPAPASPSPVVKPDKKNEISNTSYANKNANEEKKSSEDIFPKNNIEYKIQLSASVKKPDTDMYKSLGTISVYQEKGMYKVMLGSFPTKDEALKKLESIRAKGYNGFIVTFENGIKK